MKVIDLLNKIANEEEVPEKIKYNGHIYELEHRVSYLYSYKNNEGDYLEDDWYLTNILNEEIEIIEDTPKENKKIEYIETNYDFVFDEQVQQDSLRVITSTINEIIDKVNKL